ncbi:hypothetical protein SPLC1_S202980 [Arthrospira platensis C1]|nr:hypothetical protein SPLC1_S202980 [Arthrospira platensis C1]
MGGERGKSLGKETGFLAKSLFFNKNLTKKPGFSVMGMG